MNPVKGGVIAAGHGTRFKEKGVQTPKPLLIVAGKPLLAWTLSQFADAGVEDVTIIFNEEIAPACKRYLRENVSRPAAHVIAKTTASSFESFCEVTRAMGDGPFLIATIDSIYRPGKLRELLRAAESYPPGAMVLGVTSFIDDEKPLYVEMDAKQKILSVGEKKTGYVTNGTYCLPPFPPKAAGAFSALRHFLADAIKSGTPAYGFDMGRSVDVDHPRDIQVAEAFVTAF